MKKDLCLHHNRGVRLSRYTRLSRYHKTYRDKDDRFINLDDSKLPQIICIPDGVNTSWGLQLSYHLETV